MVIDYDIPSEQMTPEQIQVATDLQSTMQGMAPQIGNANPKVLQQQQLKPEISGGENLG